MSTPRRYGRAIADTQDEALARADLLPAARARLLSATIRPKAPPSLLRRRAPGLAALSAVAAAAALLALWLSGPRGPARSPGYTVGEGSEPGATGAWLSVPAGSTLPIGFEGGSRVVLMPETRARVAEVDGRGARVVIERGAAHVSVVHRDDTRFRVEVGPFEVLVTGTRFDVGWDASGQAMSLAMAEGRVEVRGPCLAGPRAVTAGQAVKLSCKPPELVPSGSVSSTQPDPPPDQAPDLPRAEPLPEAPAASAERPPRAPLDPPRPSSAGQPSPSPPAPSPSPAAAPADPGASGEAARPASPSWKALSQAGKYREALSAAEASGFEAECQAGSAADVWALAEAARLAGNEARARQALLALRARFPGEARAATAAYHLGKMAFDRRGAYAEAAQWLSTYLAEQPSGPLAREALGRLCEARSRSGDAGGAREAARRYLERFPDGPHAPFARGLLDDAGP